MKIKFPSTLVWMTSLVYCLISFQFSSLTWAETDPASGSDSSQQSLSSYFDAQVLQNFPTGQVIVELKEGLTLSDLSGTEKDASFGPIYQSFGTPEVSKIFSHLDEYKWVKIFAEKYFLQPYDLRWKARLAGHKGFFKIPRFNNYYLLQFPRAHDQLVLMNQLSESGAIEKVYPNLISFIQNLDSGSDDNVTGNAKLDLLRPWLVTNGFPVLAQNAQLNQINVSFLQLITSLLQSTDIKTVIENEMNASANDVVLNDPDWIYFPGRVEPIARSGCGVDDEGNSLCSESYIYVRFYPSVSNADRQALFNTYNLSSKTEIETLDVYTVKIPATSTVSQVLQQLEGLSQIWYAEPLPHIQPETNTFYPDDVYLEYQWYHENAGYQVSDLSTMDTTYTAPDYDLDSPQGWFYGVGSHDVIVAVIDSGIDYDHPDFHFSSIAVSDTEDSGFNQAFVNWMEDSNIYFNAEEYWANLDSIATDADGNGIAADYMGLSLLNETPSGGRVADTCGHGTSVAGVLGAAGNNNESYISGVAQRVKILPIRLWACDPNGNRIWGDVANVAHGIEYAALKGAKILSMSFTYHTVVQTNLDAIQLYSSVLFMSSAGNADPTLGIQDISEFPHYPASHSNQVDNLIGVSGYTLTPLTQSNSVSNPENYGRWNTSVELVQIAAPADNILTLDISNNNASRYVITSGTSMATPIVAGIAAVALGSYTRLNTDRLKTCVLNGADQNEGLNGIYENGRLANLQGTMEYCVGTYGHEGNDPNPNDTGCNNEAAAQYTSVNECEADGAYIWDYDLNLCRCEEGVGAAGLSGEKGGFGCQLKVDQKYSYDYFMIMLVLMGMSLMSLIMWRRKLNQ